MRKLAAVALASLLLFTGTLAVGLAQDDPPAVVMETETTTIDAASGEATVVTAPADQAPDIVTDTTVVIPVGSWIEQVTAALRDTAVAILIGALVWVSRLLPEGIRQYINEQRIRAAEQLLGQAVDYGFNAVRGATKGMKVEVNVGSSIVAQAAQYAIDNGPAWLIKWLGGVDGIKAKLAARLDLTPDATAGAVIAGAPDPKG